MGEINQRMRFVPKAADRFGNMSDTEHHAVAITSRFEMLRYPGSHPNDSLGRF
ncbi:hypothetical protein PTE30175_05054 [Pandoraea terrae]|uniref:Uncharacterized protein n=1 Tax=Pandoraea terrae TaxID=1537710 RepID=A0A5E4Z8B0_9BURK|nr:hypothetical protein [Pandoraea terrae]VVE57038.1 hypothetical protein PTE30175_05054 [Pandoraea terrae]